MTTELTGAAFDVEETTLTQPIDVDALIDAMTPAQVDKLALKMRRRAQEKLKAAAALAEIKAEQERAANPTVEQRERRFRANHEDIPCVLNQQHGVVFHQDGSERYTVGELAMPGAQSDVLHGGERGPLPQLRSMHMYWQTLRDEAEQRLAAVLQDTARYQQHETYYHAPPGALQANAIEQRRVQGSIAAIDEVLTALLDLIGKVGDIERRTKDQGERNRQISEAISTVPAAARWMSSATALWRSR
jgi:hypothetical protein